jgi:hypothetical protein
MQIKRIMDLELKIFHFYWEANQYAYVLVCVWYHSAYARITVTQPDFTKVILCNFCKTTMSHHDSGIPTVIPNMDLANLCFSLTSDSIFEACHLEKKNKRNKQFQSLNKIKDWTTIRLTYSLNYKPICHLPYLFRQTKP